MRFFFAAHGQGHTLCVIPGTGLLHNMAAAFNKVDLTIVMITHDLGVVANIADRVAVMYAGDIVEIGTADEIYYDPRHPYTWALLSSMPQMGVKGEDLFNIVGVTSK